MPRGLQAARPSPRLPWPPWVWLNVFHELSAGARKATRKDEEAKLEDELFQPEVPLINIVHL